MPGLVAAKIGAQNVILSDNSKVNKWLSLIQETLSLNNMIADRIRIENLDWYNEQSIDELIKKYFPSNIDIMIGSDIFFQKKGTSSIITSPFIRKNSFKILKQLLRYWTNYSRMDNHL